MKKLAVLGPDDPCFIPGSVIRYEKFLAVHGQIILNQLKGYGEVSGDKRIAKSAVFYKLKEEMAACTHTAVDVSASAQLPCQWSPL